MTTNWQMFAAGTFIFFVSVGLFIARSIVNKLFKADVPFFLPYLALTISLILMLQSFNIFGDMFTKIAYNVNIVEISVGFVLILFIATPLSKNISSLLRKVIFLISLIMLADGSGLFKLYYIFYYIRSMAYQVGFWFYYNKIEGIAIVLGTIVLSYFIIRKFIVNVNTNKVSKS